jgi:hypothetical protein
VGVIRDGDNAERVTWRIAAAAVTGGRERHEEADDPRFVSGPERKTTK